jgi:hypothetical protein
MNNLDKRIEKLEARQGLKKGSGSIVVTYPTNDPDRVTVNGQSMTHAELGEYAANQGLTVLNIVYLPDNGRSSLPDDENLIESEPANSK